MKEATIKHALARGRSLLTCRAIPTVEFKIPPLASSERVWWIDSTGTTRAVGFSRFDSSDGMIYCDGSVKFPSNLLIAAGGWACVQLDPHGGLLKALVGVLPGFIAQTAVNSEHCAILYAASFIKDNDQCILGVDCAAVVAGWANGYKRSAGANKIQGGFWREIQRQGNWPKIKDIMKIKAHVVAKDDMDEALKMAIAGNALADYWARRGADLHRGPAGEDDVKAYLRARSENSKILRAIGNVLALCPLAPATWPNASATLRARVVAVDLTPLGPVHEADEDGDLCELDEMARELWGEDHYLIDG